MKRLNIRNISETRTELNSAEITPSLAPISQTELPLKKNAIALNTNRKNMSMSDVSDMLIELYKANVANAPKNQQSAIVAKLRQTSPSSAESNEPSSIAAIATKGASSVIASKNLQNDEMVSTVDKEQQRQQQQQQQQQQNTTVATNDQNTGNVLVANVENAPFHHQSNELTNNIIKRTNATENKSIDNTNMLTSLCAIPVPVVVTPNSPQIDVKPIIHPTTGLVISSIPEQGITTGLSVIKPVPTITNITTAATPSLVSSLNSATNEDVKDSSIQSNNITNSSSVNVLPQAAAIAAVLLRDGYNNFQQHLRTQELINVKGHNNTAADCSDIVGTTNTTANNISTKILETLLRQQQRERRFKSENDNQADTNATDGDDEDDSRYNDFDDIHLVENSKGNFNNNTTTISGIFHPTASTSTTARLNSTNFDYISDDSQKIMFAAQAQALRNFEYSFSDTGHNSFGNISNDASILNNNDNGDGIEPVYECRHCGKKYRWKSTLRRHENVECGGKEPSHQCPYCPYKSKQRGNLGVHVRKHHSDLPQLASKRRSKYSHKLDSSNNSANASDDSSSRLIIDCSK